MKNYIFNTTKEKIDTSEMDKVINFACKKMNVKNPLLNIVLVNSLYRTFFLPTYLLEFDM